MKQTVTYMVDETVFRSVVLGLESTEKGLFGTEDLNGRSGVLCQVHQTSGVTDESGTNEFTDEGGEIRSDGLHSVTQILG